MANHGPERRAANRSAWDDRELGAGPIALGILTGATLAADTGGTNPAIPVDRLGDFVRLHRGREIVCRDAAELFWGFHDRLGGDNDRRDLWHWARAGRIRDVELADRLLKFHEHATRDDDDRLTSPSLVAVARRLAALDDRSGGGDPPPVIGPALLERWQLQAPILAEAAGWWGMAADSPERRVRGRIALQRPGRAGVRLYRERAGEIRGRLERAYQACSDALRKDKAARATLKWHQGRVRRTSSGSPSVIRDAAREWLPLHLTGSQRGDRGMLTPLAPDGRISTRPEDWSRIALGCPLLRDWCDLHAAGLALRAFESGPTAEARVPLRFEVAPRLTCSPDLDTLRRLAGGPLIEPDPGHVLMVVRLADLSARCQAFLVERVNCRPTNLGQLLRVEGDFVENAALSLGGIKGAVHWSNRPGWNVLVGCLLRMMDLELDRAGLQALVELHCDERPPATTLAELYRSTIGRMRSLGWEMPQPGPPCDDPSGGSSGPESGRGHRHRRPLAEDILLEAAFGLAEVGLDVIAVVGEEILVQVPAGGGAGPDPRPIEAIILATAARLLASEKMVISMPIPCHVGRADSW